MYEELGEGLISKLPRRSRRGSSPKYSNGRDSVAGKVSVAIGGRFIGGAPSWCWRAQKTSVPKMTLDICHWRVKTLITSKEVLNPSIECGLEPMFERGGANFCPY